MKGIKNIIFDLGAVLLQLNTGKTDAAFRELAGSEAAYTKMLKVLTAKDVFNVLEVGGISGNEFVAAFLEQLPPTVDKNDIYKAWNAMLLDFPKEVFDLIEKLRKAGYRLYVLSNTNEIHLKCFRQIIETAHGIKDFDDLFDKAYYSHLIQLRKPNAAIFEYVIKDAGILAEETLFIDDNKANIASAKAAGLNVLLHPANADIGEHLASVLN